MTRLDWEREQREARSRKPKPVFPWDDPTLTNPETRRLFFELTERPRAIVAESDDLDVMGRLTDARNIRARLKAVEESAYKKAQAADASGILVGCLRDWFASARAYLGKQSHTPQSPWSL